MKYYYYYSKYELTFLCAVFHFTKSNLHACERVINACVIYFSAVPIFSVWLPRTSSFKNRCWCGNAVQKKIFDCFDFRSTFNNNNKKGTCTYIQDEFSDMKNSEHFC